MVPISRVSAAIALGKVAAVATSRMMNRTTLLLTPKAIGPYFRFLEGSGAELMNRTQPRNKGFNLVELVVAIGILSFGIYGAAELLGASRHTATEGSRRIEATALGNLKLQEFSAARGNLTAFLAATTGTQGTLHPPDTAKPFEQNPAYTWQAHFQQSAEMAEKVDVLVSVRSAKARAGEAAVAEVRGFVIVPATGVAAAAGGIAQ